MIVNRKNIGRKTDAPEAKPKQGTRSPLNVQNDTDASARLMIIVSATLTTNEINIHVSGLSSFTLAIEKQTKRNL